jgi:uncharacterized protein (TIGR00369 family)
MRRKVIGTQNISRMCLVCGVDNPLGLRGRFYELETGELAGLFSPREEHQSYPHLLHGGISAAILDETIGRAIIIAHPGTWGVTAEFTIRYRRPVPSDGEVRAIGRITRDTPRVFEGTGEIILEDGTVAVEAAGKYVKRPLEAITADGLDETQWFADEREPPAALDL